MNTEISRLGWRFTCPRHQERFVHVVRSAGVEDEADMELIRRQFMTWWSWKAPATFFEMIHTTRCAACIAEEHGMDFAPGTGALIELAKALLSSRP